MQLGGRHHNHTLIQYHIYNDNKLKNIQCNRNRLRNHHFLRTNELFKILIVIGYIVIGYVMCVCGGGGRGGGGGVCL